MTCREKLAIEHPGAIDWRFAGGCEYCPLDGQTDEDNLIAAFRNICEVAWEEGKTKKLVKIMERMGTRDD